MAREVITTSLLVIASVVAVAALINAVFPSIHKMTNSFNSLANSMEEKIETDMDIIFITTNGNFVYFWVKNTGSSKVSLSYFNNSDVFIYSSSNYWRAVFEGTSNPRWNYTVENGDGDGYWDSGETIKVTVEFDSLPSGEYKVTLVLYNGLSVSDIFSV
jgi:flagellar protein FlaG